MNKLRVIISGGGTGGHIFPALAIAKEIERQVDSVDFLFVGAKDRMEMEKVPNAGYKIIGLWISGLQRSFDKRNLLFPFKLIHSIYKAKQIIRAFKPNLVIGTGGFASAPIIYVAAKNNIPTLIQEQNSYPGITNRILSKYVNKICVAYESMQNYFPEEKIINTGNPIRQDILMHNNLTSMDKDLFDIDDSKPTILILGGSLGALTINNAIAESISMFKDMGVNLIWQTGINYQNKAKDIIEKLNIRGINSYVFIKEMDKAYAIADVIISRAGAIAISELCSVGKPIILVPSPNVSENHQYKNAQSLVNKNAALIVEDADSSRKLVKELFDLIKNKELQESLSSNIQKIAVRDAATRIAKIALDLVK